MALRILARIPCADVRVRVVRWMPGPACVYAPGSVVWLPPGLARRVVRAGLAVREAKG